MKSTVRKIAIERMQILIENAITNVKTNPKLSQRQAFLARRISTRRILELIPGTIKDLHFLQKTILRS